MKYLQQLNECFEKIESMGPDGKKLRPEAVVTRVVGLVISAAHRGNKIMVIGNGGSASIASHMAIDLLKNAKVPALAFNDPSFLTCLANDLGYEAVFEKPVEMLSKKGDVLFAISSSGKSVNILNAVRMAKKKNVFVVTLSGFSRNNPLAKLGGVNFYAPSLSYGFVELTHSAICHWIVDTVMDKKSHG
ncbi:MAG: SIS domain-containing protein [Candidatus Omnitrophota bacterium]